MIPDRTIDLLAAFDTAGRAGERPHPVLVAETLRRLPDADVGERERLANLFRECVQRRLQVDRLVDAAAPSAAGEELARLRIRITLLLCGDADVAALARRAPGVDWDAIRSLQAGCALHPDPATRLEFAGSLPPALASRLLRDHGEEAFGLAAALLEAPPRVLRVNTLVGSRDEMLRSLEAQGFDVEAGRHAPQAIVVRGPFDAFRHPLWQSGAFELQDEASQLVAALVAPPPRGRVVDLCAGAGGKTLALSALLANRGEILALDPSPRRLEELGRRARRAGAYDIRPVALDPEAWPDLVVDAIARADRILVDAPCSGSGSWRRHPDARWSIGEAEIARLRATQATLLDRVAGGLAVGSRMIHATCSVFREENEAPIEALLARRPDLSPVRPREILGRALGETFETPCGRFFASRPDRHGCDGFFAAVLRRT